MDVKDEVAFLNRYFPEAPATQSILKADCNEADFLMWLTDQIDRSSYYNFERPSLEVVAN